jgi:hypothetical protein
VLLRFSDELLETTVLSHFLIYPQISQIVADFRRIRRRIAAWLQGRRMAGSKSGVKPPHSKALRAKF